MAFSPTHGRLDIAYVQSPVLGHGLEREKVEICYKHDLVSASKDFQNIGKQRWVHGTTLYINYNKNQIKATIADT